MNAESHVMTLEQALRRAFADAGTVLLVAADDLPLPEPPEMATLTRANRLRDIAADRRYDLAVVDSASPLDADEVAPTLARLRDLSARRVLVCVREPCATVWQRGRLIGQGFTALGAVSSDAGPVTLFQFDIASYKHTPDWLNPDNWANPELWDRYRW